MKKLKTTKIVIRVSDGRKPNGVPRVVDAHVFGVWAAHEAQNAHGWNITHVPTGRAVGVGKSEFGAILAARQLSLDLDAADVKTVVKNADHVKLIVSAVR